MPAIQPCPTSQDFTMDSGGSNPENQALAARRTQAFVQEPTREGNVSVTLPDQTADAEISRHNHKQKIEEVIRAFEQQFNQ